MRVETYAALGEGVRASLGQRFPRGANALTTGAAGAYTIYLVSDAESDWWDVLGEMYARSSDADIDGVKGTFADFYPRMAAVTNMDYLLLHEIVHVAIDEVVPGVYIGEALGDVLREIVSVVRPDPFTHASLSPYEGDLLSWGGGLAQIGEIVSYKWSNFWYYLVSDNETDAGAYTSEVAEILDREPAVAYPAKAIPLPNFATCPAVLNPPAYRAEVKFHGPSGTSERTVPKEIGSLHGTYSTSWCGNGTFTRAWLSRLDFVV